MGTYVSQNVVRVDPPATSVAKFFRVHCCRSDPPGTHEFTVAANDPASARRQAELIVDPGLVVAAVWETEDVNRVHARTLALAEYIRWTRLAAAWERDLRASAAVDAFDGPDPVLDRICRELRDACRASAQRNLAECRSNAEKWQARLAEMAGEHN